MRALLRSAGAGAGAVPSAPEVLLSDVLAPEHVASVVGNETLHALLPPDLPEQGPDVTRRVLTSPQFRAAVREFDRALGTGALGDLVRGLGLPESAGEGREAFLRAITDQAENMDAEEQNMQTD